MQLTTSLLADLHTIYQVGKFKPQTPAEHDVVRQLFDAGLLIIHPNGPDSTYSIKPETAMPVLLPRPHAAE